MINKFKQEIDNYRVQAELEQKERDEESRFFVALRELAKNNIGRKVLKHLLTLSNLDEDPFTPDPIVTAYNCGRKRAGVELRREILTACGQDGLQAILNEVI